MAVTVTRSGNAAPVSLADSHWADRTRCVAIAGRRNGGACAHCRGADSGGALTRQARLGEQTANKSLNDSVI